MSTVSIPLTQGKSTLIDEDDRDLADNRWLFLAGGGKRPGYAARWSPRSGSQKRRWIYLHRRVLERALDRPLSLDERVDHINRDPLDNRRCNLRIATTSQNAMNCHRPLGRCAYRGVSWIVDKRDGRGAWRASIRVCGKYHFIGNFGSAEEAAHAYDLAAKEFHGDFAIVNFPEELT